MNHREIEYRLFELAMAAGLGRAPSKLLPSSLRAAVERKQLFEHVLEREHFGFPSREHTVPPDGERFAVHAVWATEFYTPLHAEVLIERLHSLGFATEVWTGDRSLPDSTRRHRSAVGESWGNLGVLTPRGSRGPGRKAVDLPSGVSAGFLSLHTLTPSLSALLLMFVLDDDEAGRFDAAMRRLDFKPHGSLTRDVFLIEPPSNVKRDAVRAARRHSRDLAVAWITEHVPGAFAAGPQPMPTAEMITTELAVPLEPSSRDLDYMWFVELQYWPPTSWVSDELEHWHLTTYATDGSVTVAARRSDAWGDRAGYSDDRSGMPQRVNEALAKNLVLLAAADLVSASHARLATIRDAGAKSTSWPSLTTRRLKKIRDEFLRDSFEARTIAAELHRYAGEKARFARGTSHWHGEEMCADEDLIEYLRQFVLRATESLQASEERLRDSLLVNATLIAAIANLRLQRWVLWLVTRPGKSVPFSARAA